MKPKHNILSTLVIAIVNAACFNVSWGETQTPNNITRWDLMMIDIEQVRVWHNLLDGYFSTANEHWRSRKASLQKITNEFPNSQWADDAALILACGKFEFENDAEGAILALSDIISRYPNGNTIISPWWVAGSGCRFDNIWEMAQGSLSYHNRDGSIRKGRPFDAHGYMSQDRKEILAYFDHLNKYPVYTKDVARIFISEILLHQGRFSDAALEYETLLSDPQFSKAVQEDAVAASQVNGYLIKNIDRPQYRAYIALVESYKKLGKSERIIAETDKLAAVVNHGANIGIVKRVGETYDEIGLESKARSQYQIALGKLNNLIDIDKKRTKLLREQEGYPNGEVNVSPFLTQEKTELENLIKAK